MNLVLLISVVQGAPERLTLALFLGLSVQVALFWRVRFLRHYIRGDAHRHADQGAAVGTVERIYSYLVGFSALLGMVLGAYCWLLFPVGMPIEQALTTVFMLGLAAGMAAMCAAFRRAFIASTAPLCAQLSLAWFAQAYFHYQNLSFAAAHLSLLVGIAIAPFYWILLRASEDTESLMRSSFDLAQKNAQLVADLQSKNEAIALERKVAQEANETKSRFLAAVSHDLRQPLHAISLYCTSLGLQGLQGRSAQLLKAIQGSISESLAPMLDGLLDMSKLESAAIAPKPESFYLNKALKAMKQELLTQCEAKGLSLIWQVPEGLSLNTDPKLFKQMLRNLLDNAVKYTDKGWVRLFVQVQKSRHEALRPSNSLHTQESQASACFIVQDSGRGISQSDQTRIFEEFYQCGAAQQDASRGLGLGLAIVRRVSKLLDTELQLTSQLGQGTRIQFSCPVWVNESHQETEFSYSRQVSQAFELNPQFDLGFGFGMGVAEPSLPSLGSPNGLDAQPGESQRPRVLVVDDQLEELRSMHGLLQDWGYEVLLASSGQEAIGIAKKQEIDLFLADFRLHQSQVGDEVLTRLGQIQSKARRCLITGDKNAPSQEELRPKGIELFHKPLNLTDFKHFMGTHFKAEPQVSL